METNENTSLFFAFAESNGLAVAPIAAGSKAPTGIVANVYSDCSRDPAQWELWASENPGCGWCLPMGPNRLAAADIDNKGEGQSGLPAWRAWCESNGLPFYAPVWLTPRGGAHVLFRLPDDTDPNRLRQPPLAPFVDVRASFKSYLVCPPTVIDGRRYMLFPGATIHNAPAALLAHVLREQAERAPSTTTAGTYDPGDVAALVKWLASHDEFESYAEWCACGMALKLALGEMGREVWALAHNNTVTPEVERSKWESFATEPGTNSVTLNSFMSRAHKLGWKGKIRPSGGAMFSAVAKLSVPSPSNMPLASGQTVVADLGRPIVETFLAAQSGLAATDAPKLPDVLSAHPLFDSLNMAAAYVVGLGERAPKIFRASAAVDMLAVLSAAHPQTFETVCARIRAAGAALPDSRLTAAARRFEAQVSREFRTGAGWATDSKGMPDSSNTDNVAIFARTISAEFRFNTWSQRMEIRWSSASEWASLQEKDFNQLLTTAANGQYNFRPRESMFKRALSALAHESTFDPVLTYMATAQSAWDGVARLDGWLARACGLPDDAYHRAVGRNLIGGIVKRARRPGVKHDEVVIFIGQQDTLKSTLCRVLALNDEWFTDSVAFEGSPQNVVPQLFGKLVVELAELDGMARREVQFIKRFLTAQSDTLALKYEAYASDHARRCVFVGTSNEYSPLRDATGNRRFLPVRIEQRIDIEFVRANIAQLVGEAAAKEAAGEIFLIPDDVLPDARARQEGARAESDYEIHLCAWFGVGQHASTYILPTDLATLLKDATGRSVPANLYGAVMRKLGFVQMTPRISSTPTRVWCRGGMEGAHRYIAHRGVDGRMTPKLVMVAPPPPGGTAVVLPMVRQ